MATQLAKSLHTVSVLVNVATLFLSVNPRLTPEEAIERTLKVLKLNDKDDVYGLAAAALKQLNK